MEVVTVLTKRAIFSLMLVEVYKCAGSCISDAL